MKNLNENIQIETQGSELFSIDTSKNNLQQILSKKTEMASVKFNILWDQEVVLKGGF